MLNHHDDVATIAVRDTAAARYFYEGARGLTVSATEFNDRLELGTGQPTILVYRAASAGLGTPTALTLPVDDKVHARTGALKAKGVHFEPDDVPRTPVEGDVHVAGERRIAWFMDPDGNALSMVSH